MSFRSGYHKAYYSPAATNSATPTYVHIGLSEDGFHFGTGVHHQRIQSDRGAEGLVDAVNTGSDITLSITWIEYDLIKLALAAFVPQGKLYDNVGRLMSALAGPLVLRPTAGTPAETEIGVGKSYIFYKAAVITPYEDLLSSRHRKGPLTFTCIPDPLQSELIWDTITTPSSALG